MKILNLHAITSNSDTMEGRGGTIIHGYTTGEIEALKIVNDPRFYKRFGVMGRAPYEGGKYYVHKKEILIFDDATEFFAYDVNAKKKQALAKLTPEEKKLLGLTS